MRGFSCTYYYKNGSKFEQEGNQSCWAGINSISYAGEFKKSLFKEELRKDKYLTFPDIIKEIDTIYIDVYTYPETKKYIPLLISLINEITPCSIVDKYICFKLLSTYDQSLILLNFIRNLWYQPFIGYTDTFFTILSTDTKYKDPLERLTHANSIGCSKAKNGYGMGHSNVHIGVNLIVKNTKQLLEYKGGSTRTFLIT